MLEAGQELVPGHRLKRRLGRGAFAEVWEATDREGREVALKCIDTRAHSRDLLRTEVRLLQQLADLHHPHIIQFFSVHASTRYLVLAMEKADGNLADLRAAYQAEAKQNIPADHLLELLDQAAEALDFLAELHLPGINLSSRALQHCDIKPTNLLLVGEALKVADFGLCMSSSGHAAGKGWRGTPPYAAPELFGASPAPGTDQYALAVTFCDLCMGERPFYPNAFKGLAPGLSPIDFTRLRERELPVLRRALHRQPSGRWPSCRAFVAALRDAIGNPRTPTRTGLVNAGR